MICLQKILIATLLKIQDVRFPLLAQACLNKHGERIFIQIVTATVKGRNNLTTLLLINKNSSLQSSTYYSIRRNNNHTRNKKAYSFFVSDAWLTFADFSGCCGGSPILKWKPLNKKILIVEIFLIITYSVHMQNIRVNG